MKRSAKAQLLQNPRQHRRESEPPAGKDLGPLAKQVFIPGEPLPQVRHDRILRHQRQPFFGFFAANDANLAGSDGLLQSFQRQRFLGLHLAESRRGQEQVGGAIATELVAKRGAEGGGRGQIQVQDEGIDRIEMVPLFRQDVETGGELLLRQRQISFDSRDCCSNRLPFEIDLVQIAAIPHLPRQQLNLQIRIPQREKIRGHVGIHLRPANGFQRRRHHFSAAGSLLDQAAPFLLHPLGKARRQPAGAHAGDDNQPVLDLGGNILNPFPGRGLAGISEQLRLPHRRPRRKQPLRIVPLVIGRKILQTMARQQNEQLLVGHKHQNSWRDVSRRPPCHGPRPRKAVGVPLYASAITISP